MIVARQNTAMKVVAGAAHAFDRADVPPTRIAEAVASTTFPTVYMDDKGVYHDLRTGGQTRADTQGFHRLAASGGFVRKGVTIGSRPDAARTMAARPDPTPPGSCRSP